MGCTVSKRILVDGSVYKKGGKQEAVELLRIFGAVDSFFRVKVVNGVSSYSIEESMVHPRS